MGRNLLMHGAIWLLLCWYPLAHLLHVTPVTPSLQGHCPVVWLQVLPDAPTGWQSHAESKQTESKQDCLQLPNPNVTVYLQNPSAFNYTEPEKSDHTFDITCMHGPEFYWKSVMHVNFRKNQSRDLINHYQCFIYKQFELSNLKYW